VSLGRVDARFLLPHAVRRAVILGKLDGWRWGLQRLGVDTTGPTAESPDLVVAVSSQARRAVALRPAAVILEGRGGSRTLRAAGFRVSRYLPLPSLERPGILLPLEQPAPAEYALTRWTVASRRWKGARNRLLLALIRQARFPPIRDLIAVGLRNDQPPHVLQTASRLGTPARPEWFLTPSERRIEEQGRNVFHVFVPGSSVPEWVVKVARVPGYVLPFEREARGLQEAAQAGRCVLDHAPRPLGRIDVDGHPASVETAAVGERLIHLLASFRSRAWKIAAIDRVAAWLIRVARETEAPPERLDEYRRLLDSGLLLEWRSRGIPADLVSRIPPVRAVFVHGDLKSYNLVVSKEELTAIDFERARRFGFPLFDLLVFLPDALAALDGAMGAEARVDHFRRLFRGELRSSPILFTWLARAVEASAIPPDAVGSLTTLCLVHRPGVPVEAVPATEAGSRARMAHAWLSDPILGPEWRRWRSAA
jgi:Phosphotransferase enzyme family